MGEMTFSHRKYGDNERQRVAIWDFQDGHHRQSGYWVIFIHGGAWRDPRNTDEDFHPTVQSILSSPPSDIPGSSIRGLASIDYRLSAHPDIPQDPRDTPAEELREARHPDHVEDVWSALRLLTRDYGLTEDYILVGHSAGATLAFQLLMGKDALPGRNPPPHGVPLPKAVVGVSGIYDLVGLDERHTGYTGFIESAFGEEKSGWRRSSPALYTGNFATNWPSRKLALLAWSQNDSLIDEPEIDSMATKLTRDGVKPVVLKNLTGDHDDVWREGVQLRMLVSDALRILSGET